MTQFSVKEYTQTLVRNILSGNNVCGSLRKAVEKMDPDYFEKMAAPVVERLVSQITQAESERDKANSARSQAQFALETFVQNLSSRPEDQNILLIRKTETLRKIVEDALGRNILW